MPPCPIIPVLRMFDETRARAFYVDFLGFQVDWTHRFEPALPLYMQLSRGDWVLHLSEHHGDGTPGSVIRLLAPALESLHREMIDRDYGFCRPALATMPWGQREVTVTDPFGNRLVFYREVTP
ncbi:glyoxalase/bleomycin resistance protein/dioxygenase [Alcanivorax sp. S71-1-4]|uniref:glyoxalase superfamily protein n=1 Tax=Alcanivorax sp. S71-1-4 TaxID=1177159 RepID=UPI001356F205|nr:glyoxalase superfamily protein [Alcanivorax sp. S71-1-4]KAF0810776.1 glyoxalase/bleomycin resistance protein/dioxygenase [Alcanivorax sp. S71-1-4]